MITHPEKVLFPDDGITKGELAAYYEAIAPIMLPHIRARPVTMERYPAGIGKKGFLPEGRLEGLSRRGWSASRCRRRTARCTIRSSPTRDRCSGSPTRTASRRTCGRRARRTCTTPTSASSISTRREDEPDVLRAAALALRDLLDELGLPSWVKTSGSKGFHIVVPLDGKADVGEVARFAHAVGALLVKRDPEHLTQEFSKADRGGRILVDTGRNGYSATFAAAYAVRAKPGAPVSAPCTWEELERGEVGPRTFTLRTMAGAHRRGRRPVVGHAQAPAVAAASDGVVTAHARA